MSSSPHSHQLSIIPLFQSSEENSVVNQHYQDIILHNLKKVLPAEFFTQKDSPEASQIHQKKILKHLLPLITYSEPCATTFPSNISFFALFKYRPSSFKFFLEMITRWLIPGRRLNLSLIYATDFYLPDLTNDEVYTLCQIMVVLDNALDLKEIQRHFLIIGTEITLGLDSAFYAQRILEIKGLSADEKTVLIQRFMASLIKRFPHVYKDDIFAEMQHVLVMCHDEFKAARQARHLGRIISVHYLFRRSIRESVKKNGQRRYLNLKIFQTFIHKTQCRKRVLSILVGVNFLKDQETLGEKHLIKAIQHYIPSVQAIDQSFFVNKLAFENICTLYLEVEKKDGTDFTLLEIRKLRRELPAHLKNCIEHKLHPIFMPRNEEEVMRNILVLSNQIKYLRDIPQVFISFDEQAHSHLSFTVILVRILKPNTPSISALFKQAYTFLEYIPDRTKIVGYIRKKYAKEATVFRLKISKDAFLRADHSIDLYKARQAVMLELSRIVGEIRDYNGGMISKQHELLSEIRLLLAKEREYDELLLENFFYSLAPVLIRALLDPNAFKILFLMLLEGIKEYKQEGYYVKFCTESPNIFALVISEDVKLKDLLQQAIYELHIPSTELATAYVKASGLSCIGYICCAKEARKQEIFCQTIQNVLQACNTFDPSKSNQLASHIILTT